MHLDEVDNMHVYYFQASCGHHRGFVKRVITVSTAAPEPNCRGEASTSHRHLIRKLGSVHVHSQALFVVTELSDPK